LRTAFDTSGENVWASAGTSSLAFTQLAFAAGIRLSGKYKSGPEPASRDSLSMFAIGGARIEPQQSFQIAANPWNVHLERTEAICL